MSRVVNAYSVPAGSLKPGDVLVRTVAAHVMEGRAGELVYRLYISGFPPDQVVGGVPQGSRVYDEEGLAGPVVFPVLAMAGIGPDGDY